MSSDNRLVVFVNGQYVSEEEAKVSIYDRAFLYGDGCFEGIVIHGGMPVLLDEHIDRLFKSLKTLRISMGYSKKELREYVFKLVALNEETYPGKISYVRIVVSRGIAPLGLENTGNAKGPTIIMVPAGSEVGLYPRRDVATEGVRVKISQWRRVSSQSLDPKIKSLNYLNPILAQIEAKEAGYDDAILLDLNGFVAEATGANVFVVMKGKLYTPFTTSALPGVTREKIMELAAKSGLIVEESNLTVYDLINADEVFMSASMKAGVKSVTSVDGVQIGNGMPGSMTMMLSKAWHKFIESSAIKKTLAT